MSSPKEDRRRKSVHDDDENGGEEQPPTKRPNAISDELVCPITQELPFDPVTAEDGRVYERSAIEKHFAAHRGTLKSPITNEPMGRRLLPSPQIKNLITNLIEARAIEGDLRDAWKEKEQEEKDTEDWKKKAEDWKKNAEDGDPTAMYNLYLCFTRGKGCKQSRDTALSWLKKGMEAGGVMATATWGMELLAGDCLTQNTADALVFITMAATMGSDVAAFRLSECYARGLYGLPINKDHAVFWAQKGLSNPVKHMAEHYKRQTETLVASINDSMENDDPSDEASA